MGRILSVVVGCVLVLALMGVAGCGGSGGGGVGGGTSNVLRVDYRADDGGDGLSWDTAFNDLQEALAAAEAGYQIWVAAGTYHPTDDEDDRDASFVIPGGVYLYGGFAGGETARSQRNWDDNVTVLSGEINADSDEGSYHVVVVDDVEGIVVIDGLTITGGRATGGAGARDTGGGVFARDVLGLTIANCIIENNIASSQGGGMWGQDVTGLVVTNSLFKENQIDTPPGDNYGYGGGVFITGSTSVTLDGCRFEGNRSLGTFISRGGALYVDDPQVPVLVNIINCDFVDNSALNGGGAIFLAPSGANILTLTISGSTFLDNIAGSGESTFTAHGGAIFGIYHHHTSITSSVFEGNKARTNGGAVYARLGDVIIIGSVFASGEAEKGAGVFAENEDTNLELINCVFWGNETEEGGALQTENLSRAIVTHCTFVGNEGGTHVAAAGFHFAGVRDDDRLVFVTNSLFWDNTVPPSGGGDPLPLSLPDPQDYSQESGAVLVIHSFVGFLGDPYPGIDNIFEGSDGDNPPVFVNLDNPSGTDDEWFTTLDGLQLVPASQGATGGADSHPDPDVALPTFDILGANRRSSPSMGAYQVQE